MTFTGQELVKKRNFYSQSENFGVTVEFSVEDPTGRYNFGVSGSSVINIALNSGKIEYDGLFIGSYYPDENYSFSIEVANDKINIKKDNIDLAYGLDSNTGNFNYFFFERESAQNNATFDFIVSGNSYPNYNIDKFGYLFSTGTNTVTGNFSNLNGSEIKIFNSFAKALQGLNYLYTKTGISSGESFPFVYSGDYTSFDFSQPIRTTFRTNIGNQIINFNILNLSSLGKAIILDEISNFAFNDENIINRNLSYTNYSGGVASSSFNTDLSFKLQYINGSGDFRVDDFAESASFTGISYGNIYESGFLTGISLIQTGNTSLTGVYSVPFSRFQWATGTVTGFFTGFGIGLASGENYTGLSYGPMSGNVYATILNGSGSFIWNNILASGLLIGSGSAINYTGYNNATGFIDVSTVLFNQSFFIGIESDPITKGIHFNNETGLVYYLSGNTKHKVNSYVDGSLIKLTSLFSGEVGNDIFVRNYNCNSALFNYSPNLIGGANFGQTGFAVFGYNEPFSGFVNSSATGSGNYSQFTSGNQNGSFSFTRTFTGAWTLYTGLSQQSLKKVPLLNNSLYSGYASLSPNNSIIFQVEHNENEFNEESVSFSISGEHVVNPLTQIIIQ